MAGGNLGDLWFDLNIKDSNVRSKLKEISEALSELDLKTLLRSYLRTLIERIAKKSLRILKI